MFTRKEIESVDQSYFEVIIADGVAVELRSRNTGHYWRIRSEYDYSIMKYHCLVEHRHKRIYPYHIQCFTKDLRGAIIKIKKHDRFQMAGRDRKAYK